MCIYRSQYAETIVKTFTKLKNCLIEAKQPLVDLSINAAKHLIQRLKGKNVNGQDTKIDTTS